MAEAQLSDEEYTWNKTNHIWINYVETGLVFGDPEWGEEGLTGNVHEGSYTKFMEGEIYSVRWLWLGTLDITEEGDQYTPLDASAFEENAENQVQINDSTEYIVKTEEEWPFSSEQDTVIVKEGLAENGIYGFYVRDDLTITYGDDSVILAKNLPSIGFYKANEASFDNYIRDEYFMSHSEMFEGMDIYVLPREGVENYSYTLDTIDRTILVNGESFDYKHISEEEPAGYYQSASSFTEPKLSNAIVVVRYSILCDAFFAPFKRSSATYLFKSPNIDAVATATTKKIIAALDQKRRLKIVLNILLLYLELISYTPYRFKLPVCLCFFQLFTKTLNMHIHSSRIAEIVKAPDLFQKLLSCVNPVWI